MNPAKELRKRIESCELQHPAYMEQFDALKQYIDDARDGFASRIEWVVGPSRVGKSMLINTLSRINQEPTIDGKRHVPVLVVGVDTSVSPVLLPSSVLTALGVPLPRSGRTSGLMDDRMYKQLELARTCVLIFEEASHLVEPGSRVPPRAAGDWFKAVADRNITILLFGVPRLRRLFESNEQLRERASAAREFRPYDFRSNSDQQAFASCVRTYAEMFRESGWPIELPLQSLVPQCYLLTGGRIGVLSKFMRELATQLAYEAPRVLTIDDCRSAVKVIGHSGHPDFPAFVKTDVSAIELTTAHAHVLETNGMSMQHIVTRPGDFR